jgi:PASTA domain
MSRLLSIVAIALLALMLGGCRGAAREPTSSETAPLPQGSGLSTVAVPNVVGLSEGTAARALAAAGLVANVRYRADVPRAGAVFGAAPAAGSDMPEGSVVVLFISLPPRLPPPGQEHEMEMAKLATLVGRHPEVFVGLYRDEAAVPHVVFGPGADPADWADRLAEAAKGISYPAAGISYRSDTCPRSLASLRAIQEEITTHQDWTENKHLAFGVGVDAKTCTVRVQSDLLARADIEALVDRYGTAVSFDTSEGSHPERLSPVEDEGGAHLEYLQM